MMTPNNITHLQITSNHNIDGDEIDIDRNITHLQITSNHNLTIIRSSP